MQPTPLTPHHPCNLINTTPTLHPHTLINTTPTPTLHPYNLINTMPKVQALTSETHSVLPFVLEETVTGTGTGIEI